MLPAEVRGAIAAWSPQGRCMLTTQDECIVARSWPEWEQLESALTSVRASRQVRDFRRLVLGGAEELVLDPQHRLRLSRAHMEYAGLSREVVLVGQVKHFEIWDAARFRRIQEQNFEGVDQELADSGIDIFL
jgi:MraZ protein